MLACCLRGFDLLSAAIIAAGRSSRSGRTHKSCRKVPGKRRTWLEDQILRLRRGGFAPVWVIAGQRPRRLWHCSRLRVRRKINWHAARLGPFSSIRLATIVSSGAVLLVQSDTQLPPNGQLRRLIHASKSTGTMAAYLVDQRGYGRHPVLIRKTLVQRIVTVDQSECRLDHLLQSLPVGTVATVPVHRFLSYARLNSIKEWIMAKHRLRVWARHS